MEQGKILRHDVLKALDTGDPFDMVFITADRRRGTGGKIKTVINWVKITGHQHVKKLPSQFQRGSAIKGKNPNHYEHKTINIYNPANPKEKPIKVHWRLIQFFNAKRVLQ